MKLNVRKNGKIYQYKALVFSLASLSCVVGIDSGCGH